MTSMISAAPNSVRPHAPGFSLLVAVAAAVAFLVVPQAGRAQVAKTWSNDTPIEPYNYWKGARVLAMGDLSVAVEDDRNPFNPYGYSGNPAGLITARDTSYAEQNSNYDDYFDTYYGRSHSVVSKTVGLRFGWLSSEKWALEGDVQYGNMKASRHDQGTVEDQSRFIRDFDTSLPDYFIPRTGDRTIGAGVFYPTGGITYARKFRSWFTFGGRFAYRTERENRTVIDDPYDFDNKSEATEFSGGVLLHPGYFHQKVRVGVFASWTGNSVTGISSSGLNEDTYDLSRPLVNWGGHVEVLGGWLHGIVEGNHHSYDGEQIAHVNWAPQFFLNPYPSVVDARLVFKQDWTTGFVGLRHNEFKTRWMADVPETPLHVGARYAYYQEYQWSRPLPDVLSPLLPIDVKRIGYDAAGGVSLDLPDRSGTVAFEVQLARENRADFTTENAPAPPTPPIPDVNMGRVSYHFGAEYYVKPWLPLRAGLALRRYDPDRGDGYEPYSGTRVSLGTAYRWNALGILFDGSYSHEQFHVTPGNPWGEIGERNLGSLSLQYLF